MTKPLVLLLAVAGLATAALAQAPRPPKVGDVHVYVGELVTDRIRYEETVTVTGVDGDRVTMQHVRTDRPTPLEGLYGPHWSILKSGFSGMQMAPLAPALPQPVQVGSRWEGTYDATAPTGAVSRMKMELTVAAQEKVTTPAGAFDTFRIDGKGYLSGVSWRGGFAVQQTAWYAPAINRFVKVEYKEQRTMGTELAYELKQFKPAD